MMNARCVTKEGRVIFLETQMGNQTIVGRREIAQMTFDRYLLRKQVRGEL